MQTLPNLCDISKDENVTILWSVDKIPLREEQIQSN